MADEFKIKNGWKIGQTGAPVNTVKNSGLIDKVSPSSSTVVTENVLADTLADEAANLDGEAVVEAYGSVFGDPSGFVNPDNTTDYNGIVPITFAPYSINGGTGGVNGLLTVIFGPGDATDNYYRYDGKKYGPTLASGLGMDLSVDIPHHSGITDPGNVDYDAGIRWVYYGIDVTDGVSGSPTTLQCLNNPTEDQIDEIINTRVVVKIIILDSSNNVVLLGRETHSNQFPARVHNYLHNVNRAKYIRGFNLTPYGISENGSIAANAWRFKIDSGIFYDEDITFTLPATGGDLGTETYGALWYRSGNEWVRSDENGNAGATTPSTQPFITSGTNVLQYNPITVGSSGGIDTFSGVLSDVTEDNFMLIHVFAVNSSEDGFEWSFIIGQEQYASKSLARAAATEEVSNLITIGLPTPEFVLAYTMIYQGNTTFGDGVGAALIYYDTVSEPVKDWRTDDVKTVINNDVSGELISTGVKNGGDVTLNGTNLEITTGSGIIVDGYTNTESTPTYTNIGWQHVSLDTTAGTYPATLDYAEYTIPASFYGHKFLYVGNDGLIHFADNEPTPSQYRTTLPLCLITFENGTVIEIFPIKVIINSQATVLNDYLQYLTLEDNAKGLEIRKAPGNDAGLSLTSGTVFHRSSNLANDITNPNIVSIPARGKTGLGVEMIVYHPLSNGGGIVGSYTSLPAIYSSGVGTTSPISNNKYGYFHVFLKNASDNKLHIVLGNVGDIHSPSDVVNALYTIHDEDEIPTELRYAIERGHLYTQGGETANFTDADISGIINLMSGPQGPKGDNGDTGADFSLSTASSIMSAGTTYTIDLINADQKTVRFLSTDGNDFKLIINDVGAGSEGHEAEVIIKNVSTTTEATITLGDVTSPMFITNLGTINGTLTIQPEDSIILKAIQCNDNIDFDYDVIATYEYDEATKQYVDNLINNLTASDISYDNTTSLLPGTNVQDAIDDLEAVLDDSVQTTQNTWSGEYIQGKLDLKSDSTHTHTLDFLSDVEVPGVTNGQVLTYNSATGKWEAAGAGTEDPIGGTASGGAGTVQTDHISSANGIIDFGEDVVQNPRYSYVSVSNDVKLVDTIRFYVYSITPAKTITFEVSIMKKNGTNWDLVTSNTIDVTAAGFYDVTVSGTNLTAGESYAFGILRTTTGVDSGVCQIAFTQSLTSSDIGFVGADIGPGTIQLPSTETTTTASNVIPWMMTYSSSGGDFNSWTTTNQITNYTAVRNNVILCDTSAGGFTVTLPLAVENRDKTIMIKKISNDAGVVTVSPQGAETIDNDDEKTINFYLTSFTVISDGSNWWVV
jgi:hypothetical protein